MADIDCPFCGAGQEICHDDGYGYSEEVMHQQECGACRKTFGYETSVSFYYEPHALPCLNGGTHDFKSTFTVPVEYTKMECACGERRKPTDGELSGIMVARGYEPLCATC